jgi:hypothetical protein
LKRSVAIFLLVIYVGASTEIHELANVPSLFLHYQEHKGLDTDITFAEFLELHYIGNHNDQTHHHERLPFKQEHSEAVHMTVALVTEVTIAQLTFHTQANKVTVIYVSQFHPSSISGGIWQPPRC